MIFSKGMKIKKIAMNMLLSNINKYLYSWVWNIFIYKLNLIIK